ncbi:MAG: hypothetical protein SWH61_15675 [Thermodesulfobacteriota bacterium]|nr:hypothetical protein [Thermodesulfobacteriota bacterium]
MSKPKNARVYIIEGKHFYDFLWGDVGEDGSVYLGLTGTGRQTVEQITVGRDFNKGQEDMIFHPYFGPHKVSFHSSGRYTLSNLVEDKADVKYRLVAHGTPLTEIQSPTRMMDVIMPVAQLKLSNKSPADIYIELEGCFENCTHICCTVYCMSESELPTFGEGCVSIIRGSTWESKNAFVSGTKIWAFILHDAVSESTKLDRSLISINGAGTN